MLRLLAGILASLPDFAFALTPEGRVLCANEAARATFAGMREGEPISRMLRAPEVLDAIRTVAFGHPVTAVWIDRVPFERQYDVRVAALGPDVAGAILVLLRDTTEARRVERMRSDFVANASHELRTPLASLLGFVETLQGPARDDAAARTRFLAIMGDQARRMARLIDDLLSLSRIERTAHVRPHDAVDLVAIARQTRDTLAALASAGDVRLDVQIDVGATGAAIVRGDRDELLRIAENLVENAIKYGGPGTVRIVVSTGGQSGTLTVRDDGPGIAAAHIPRLTERFFRVDNATSRAKGGTGLGLAIVKHSVARHGGRLSIRSSVGQGATFAVALPLLGSENHIENNELRLSQNGSETVT